MNNQISLTVNGIQHTLESVAGETLSTLLRERLRLIGTKIGCEEAECGADDTGSSSGSSWPVQPGR